MGTTRRLSLVIGVLVMALMVIFTLQANRLSSAQAPTSQPYTGMGEWRRFEVQQTEGSRAVAGIGDLRRFEAQQSEGSRAVAGIGDLRRFEAQAQALIPITGGSASSRPAAGMGELRRFEGQPSTAPKSSLPIPEIAVLSRSVHSDTPKLLSEATQPGPGR